MSVTSIDRPRSAPVAGGVREIILFVRPADGRIVEADHAAFVAYGYDREALLGLTVVDVSARTKLLVRAQKIEVTCDRDLGTVYYGRMQLVWTLLSALRTRTSRRHPLVRAVESTRSPRWSSSLAQSYAWRDPLGGTTPVMPEFEVRASGRC